MEVEEKEKKSQTTTQICEGLSVVLFFEMRNIENKDSAEVIGKRLNLQYNYGTIQLQMCKR